MCQAGARGKGLLGSCPGGVRSLVQFPESRALCSREALEPPSGACGAGRPWGSSHAVAVSVGMPATGKGKGSQQGGESGPLADTGQDAVPIQEPLFLTSRGSMEKEGWETLESSSAVSGPVCPRQGQSVVQTPHLEAAYWNFLGGGRNVWFNQKEGFISLCNGKVQLQVQLDAGAYRFGQQPASLHVVALLPLRCLFPS